VPIVRRYKASRHGFPADREKERVRRRQVLSDRAEARRGLIEQPVMDNQGEVQWFERELAATPPSLRSSDTERHSAPEMPTRTGRQTRNYADVYRSNLALRPFKVPKFPNHTFTFKLELCPICAAYEDSPGRSS
jgi:hypothetical protein